MAIVIDARPKPKKPSRSNPARPPREWWKACIAKGKDVRSARAVCGAAWWKMPEVKRYRIVRRMERGSARDRRSAVALARAEARHHKKNLASSSSSSSSRTKKNGPAQRGHWGGALRTPELVRLTYATHKDDDDGEITEYEHDFEGTRPKLVDERGTLRIRGGSYRITPGGIDG